jgi:hypothetical protein
MGSAASTSVAQAEARKPLDASDIIGEEAAHTEVKRLRALLKEHVEGGVKVHSSVMEAVENDWLSGFDIYDDMSSSFVLEKAPQLKEYLINSFYRFCGKDELLSWDEFWRFAKEVRVVQHTNVREAASP